MHSKKHTVPRRTAAGTTHSILVKCHRPGGSRGRSPGSPPAPLANTSDPPGEGVPSHHVGHVVLNPGQTAADVAVTHP